MYPLQRLWHLPADMWNKLPLRIDLPIPFLQIDIVFVNDPGQIEVGFPIIVERTMDLFNPTLPSMQCYLKLRTLIQILREDVDCGRMHQVPSEQQPGWV